MAETLYKSEARYFPRQLHSEQVLSPLSSRRFFPRYNGSPPDIALQQVVARILYFKSIFTTICRRKRKRRLFIYKKDENIVILKIPVSYETISAPKGAYAWKVVILSKKMLR
jgi:hypothetical protein